MALSAGDKLGPYEILAPLGAGGMGEVYRACDTKLGREVALKVLPESFARDPERMARFEREAKVLASLNHPNIAQLYGLEDFNGRRVLVMEYVPGETLACPFPLDEIPAVLGQLIDALEEAHERNIVHRDLKPANLKVTPEGKLKVLDFGLAKAMTADPSDAEAANSPTLATALTQGPVLLGTAAYMSPEQARGRRVDKRSDIFSFGVVLYEMLTGEQAFGGETISDSLAGILKHDPDLARLPAETPANLRRLLVRCLEKDPKKRLRDIGDARDLLEAVPPALAELSPVRRQRPWMPWAIAGVCLLLAAISLVWRRSPAATPAERAYFDIAPPPGTRFIGVPAFSPDGRSIAFVAAAPGAVNMLYVRSLDAFAARALPGTEGALFPFWSPDGRSLGFTTRNGLKRIELAGGSPRVLYELRLGGNNGTWNQSGDILFFAGHGEEIQRISEGGGALTPVTRLDKARGERSHRFPQFLPDGKHFLFFVYGAGSGEAGAASEQPLPGITGDESGNTVELATLGAFERKTVLRGVSMAVYTRTPGGNAFLLYVRNNALLAQRFDESAGEVSGEPFNIAPHVGGTGAGGFRPNVAASPDDMVVYNPENFEYTPTRMAWFDRQGKKLRELPPEASGFGPSLSPDGKRLAMYRIDPARRTSDIWISGLEGTVASRFTFLPQGALSPVWSPDGKKLAFSDAQGRVYEKNADGSSEPRLLGRRDSGAVLYDWSSDGKYLLAADTSFQMWLLDTTADPPAKPIDLVHGVWGRFSPDGKFVAFTSTSSEGVNVIRMPPAAGKWQVSSGHGNFPSWRRDGKELYFLAGDSTLMAVDVQLGQTVQFSVPRRLFGTGIDVAPTNPYVVSADGQRFLIPLPGEAPQEAAPPLTVVVNWAAGVKR